MNRTFKWNWAALLAFAGFWCYGYMGAVPSIGGTSPIIFSTLLAFLFAFYAWLFLYDGKEFEDSCVVTAYDAFILSSYIGILLVCSWGELLYPLSGDQLSHAYYSQIHALKGSRKIAASLPGLTDFPAKAWVQVGSLSLFVSALGFLLLLKNLRKFYRLVGLVFVFLLCRWAVWKLGGGNNDVHPTLRLFPVWLSSTLLGLNPFAFRLPQFLALIGTMWFFARRISRRTGSQSLGWAGGLVLGTVPVFWHTGILLEASIWSAAVWTCLFVELITLDEREELNLVRWASLLALASLMRQPSFIGLGALGAFALITRRKSFLHSKWLYSLPVILPTLLNAILKKTPALATSPNSHGRGMELVWDAISSGRVTESVMHSIPLLWVAVGMIGLGFTCRYLKLALTTLLFVLITITIFYSIDPNLWGVGRYQTEYFMPLVALGIGAGLICLSSLFEARQWILQTLGFLLVFYNISEFKALPSKADPVDIRKLASNYRNARVLSELHYRYDEAFRAVKDAKLSGKTALLGVGYGAMNEVLYGFSLKDWISEFQVEQEIVLAKGRRGVTAINSFSSQDVAFNPKISLVLISDAVPAVHETMGALVTDLEKNGFINWKRFEDLEHGSTIIAMVRKRE